MGWIPENIILETYIYRQNSTFGVMSKRTVLKEKQATFKPGTEGVTEGK